MGRLRKLRTDVIDAPSAAASYDQALSATHCRPEPTPYRCRRSEGRRVQADTAEAEAIKARVIKEAAMEEAAMKEIPTEAGARDVDRIQAGALEAAAIKWDTEGKDLPLLQPMQELSEREA